MATLKKLHTARLTLDDGTTVDVERIGRGRYATAWRNGSSVYLQVKDGPDCSKEIMESLCGDHACIPATEHMGALGDAKLYRQPLYHKLRAKDYPEAWRIYKRLRDHAEAAHQEAHRREPMRFSPSRSASEVLGGTVDRVAADMEIPKAYRLAIGALSDEVQNYGDYHFEFCPRNLAVDNRGRLILLDPVFNWQEVSEDIDRRRKRARGY